MARMHSGRKGKSGSKKPLKTTLPTWVRYKSKEVELLIVKLAKEGQTSSQIGTTLRDTYGIPDERKITSKRITAILKKKNILGDVPEDLIALIKKAANVKKHIERNKKDNTAKRGLTLTESKIKRLIKYYKRSGRLSSEWKYDPEKVNIFVG